MTGNDPYRDETVERIETLHTALSVSLESARSAIDSTRRLQDSSMQRIAAMQRIERANHALDASIGLMTGRPTSPL